MTNTFETADEAIKALHGKIAYLEVDDYVYETELTIFLDGKRHTIKLKIADRPY